MEQAIRQILDNQILIMRVLKGINDDTITEITEKIEESNKDEKHYTMVASEDEVVRLRCISYNTDLQHNINMSCMVRNSLKE